MGCYDLEGVLRILEALKKAAEMIEENERKRLALKWMFLRF